MMNELLSKFASGRYVLTIISGLTFAYAVYAKILPPEATASILTSVFTSYFLRDRTKENGQPK